MKSRSIALTGFLLVIALAGGLLTACGQAPASATPPSVQSQPPALQNTDASAQNTAPSALTTNSPAPVANASDGLTLLQQRCSACHDPNLVSRFQGTASDWKNLVDAMLANGAQLNPSEEQTLVNYLAQTYHP